MKDLLRLLANIGIHKWVYTRDKVNVTIPDRNRSMELTFINRTCLWNGKKQHKRGERGYMFNNPGNNKWKKGHIKGPNMRGVLL